MFSLDNKHVNVINIRMVRILLLGLLACVHMPLYALGLGEMLTRSSINQPLDADIELLAVPNEQLKAIKVRLADAADFQRAGVTRTALLERLQFRVTRTNVGKPVIRVSSDAPIVEPFLNFLLELEWPNGRLLHEYTALLDPPTTTQRKPPKITPPVGQIDLASTQASPPLASAQGTVPRTDEYGPVKAKETLWSIAGRVRPDSATVQQMMLALQRANPQAFIDGNINRLRKGQILRIPVLDEVLKMSPSQAAQVFRQQLDAFSTTTNSVVPEQRAKLPSAATPDARQQSGKQPVTQSPVQNPGQPQQLPGRLQIATPRPGQEGKAGAGENRGDIQDNYELTEQLMRARENAETARQETNILRSEIDDLQARLADMQRLLSLKDEQLAQLQDSTQRQQTALPSAPANAADAAAEETNPVKLPPGQAVPAQPSEVEQPPDGNQQLINPATLPDNAEPQAQNAPGLVLPERVAVQASTDDPLFFEPVAALKNAWDGATAALSTAWRAIARQPLYLAVLAVGLMLLLAWLVIRRKRNERVVEEIAAQDPFDMDYSAAPKASGMDMPPDENDPINQADMHIAYGRFQQAENVLEAAQQKSPDRFDIRHKLFEVYHATQNSAAFTALAQTMLSDNQQKNDPQAWVQIMAMGAELEPDNLLFHAGSANNAATPQNANPHEIEFALEEPPGPAKKPPADSNPPELQPAGLDQPLDIEQAFQSVVDENNNVVQIKPEPAETENDDVKNKLDLARVYIDMGDVEGARDILQEVQIEGSQRQKTQASELLAQIA